MTDHDQSERFDTMIREMSAAFFRVTGVEPTREQQQTVELEIRATFGGERIYIAGQRKAQRARQLARLQLSSTRELTAASGLPRRTVQRLINGK